MAAGRRFGRSVVAAMVSAAAASQAKAQLAAFPGAQGFGGNATGGRDTSIYVVTNLNATGAGSFDDAVSQSNRIIVFAVSGQINLTLPVGCKSNLTILGQTAPGQGIALTGQETSFNNSTNCIVQDIRCRVGNKGPSTAASINLGDSDGMILDHVSAEFSQYDNIDAVGDNSAADNITVQNSMLADPIGSQWFNMHTEGNQTTYLNNLFTNGNNRSPLAKSNTQFVNNVDYNDRAGYTTGSSSGHYSYDIVNNYFITGPSSQGDASEQFYQLGPNQSAYSSGNYRDSNYNGVLDGSSILATQGTKDSLQSLTAEWSPETKFLPTLTAAQAVTFDVTHSGAMYANGDGTFGRDQIDSQVASQVASLGTTGAVINEQADDGLANDGFGTMPADTVSSANTVDTVPFSWLTTHGLSTATAAAQAGLLMHNALGYDLIEQYAQQIQDQYGSMTVMSGDYASLNYPASSPALYTHLLVRGTGATNGSLAITSADNASAFTVSVGGNGPAAGENLNVSGGSLTVQDTIYVGDQNNATFTLSNGTVQANNIQLGNTVFDSNGNPTNYTGTFNFSGGTLEVGEIVQGVGTPGSYTSGAAWTWSGGTLEPLGGSLTVSAPATLSGVGGTINTVGPDGLTYNAVISGALGGTGSLTITGPGTTTLSGASTYTGVTTVTGGSTVSIATLPNGAAGPLGENFNASGVVLDGGTLQFLATAPVSANRLFSLTTNGGTLDSSGGATFALDGPGSVGLIGSGARLLTLTGTTAGHNHFGVVLGDNGGSTSLTKTGTGEWDFTVAQKYSGNTTVSSGTLEMLTPNALAYGAGDGNLIINTPGIFEMHDNAQSINGLVGTGQIQCSFGTQNLTIGNGDAAGVFSGGILTGINLFKVGAGVEELSGANTYTGPTTINGGGIKFDALTSIGGTGVSVTVNSGGGVGYTGGVTNTTFLGRVSPTSTGALALTTADAATALNFKTTPLSAYANMAVGAVDNVTYTGVYTPATSTYRLGGGGGTLNYTPLIADGGTPSSVLIGNTGSSGGVVLSDGGNTYTGATTITGGTLSGALANGGAPSAIGESSNAATNLILNGGTLAGSGATDRLFTLTSNGGTLDNSAGVNFTNTGPIALPAASNAILTLTGTNGGHEDFAPALADQGGGFVTSVVKNGTGKWTFESTGDKTYSGDTDINAGTLETLNTNAVSPNSNIVIASAGIFEMHENSSAINGLSGTGTVNNSFASNQTLTMGSANGSGSFSGTINSGGTLNLVKTGTGSQTLSGLNNFSGATTVNGGVLDIASAITNNSSSFVTIANDSSGATQLIRATPAGQSYDNWGSAAGSDLASHADIRVGQNSTENPNGESVTMQWRTRTLAETAGLTTGAAIVSDVMTLTGMANSGATGEGQTDPYALQMTYNSGALSLVNGVAGPQLDWYNTSTSKYANAITGNYTTGSSVYSDVLSSWDSFASAHSITDSNIGTYLGSWGVDTTDGLVWAVVDHNSTFAVGDVISVPEPTAAVLALASLGLLARRKRGKLATDEHR